MPGPLNRWLPCAHHFVRAPAAGDDTLRRVCPTCGKTYLGTLARSKASDHVGHELLRIEWAEVPKVAPQSSASTLRAPAAGGEPPQRTRPA